MADPMESSHRESIDEGGTSGSASYHYTDSEGSLNHAAREQSLQLAEDYSNTQPPPDQDDEAPGASEEYQMEGVMEDDEYEPSEQEILEYCEWLGLDPVRDKALTWIAREALKAPLPEYWKICYVDGREVYYFNMRTGESIWDHPMDAYYKALFRQEKAKLEKKRKEMRFHPGSLPILPLQDFFSHISDLGATESGRERLWHSIPEVLCDPIDFKLYVDPVVLPTSGRTVSKHTIINNKWRDPFSREYVENKRLIPNVDKRQEVGNWLASAITDYFRDVAFPPEVTSWAAKQPGPLTAKGSGVLPTALPTPHVACNIAEMLDCVISALPYLLDKEEEVCLKAQQLVLTWVRTAFSLSPPQRSRSAGSRGNAVPHTPPSASPRDSTPQRKKGEGNSDSQKKRGRGAVAEARAARAAASTEAPTMCHKDLREAIMELSDPALLLGPLLTMSTSASIEALFLILYHCPLLKGHDVFCGFNADILNVLQLNNNDLVNMSTVATQQHGENSVSTLATTNTEHLLKLAWVVLIADAPTAPNVLGKLEWCRGFPLVAMAYNSLTVNPHQHTLLCNLLRGLTGWPENIKYCDQDTVRLLVNMAVADTSLHGQILLLYDVLVNSNSDVAYSTVKKHKVTVMQTLLSISPAEEKYLAYGAKLAAHLVFHEIVKLDEFGSSPRLQLLIANDLLPRLTRLQWRPKHFENTLTTMVAAVEHSPAMAWGILRAEKVDFLLRELSKKKNSEDLRIKLEAIEATERRLQQSYAINNWLLLSAGLQTAKAAKGVKGLAGVKQAGKRRCEILNERVTNIVLLLNTLLSVRYKPKSRRGEDVPRPPGSDDPRKMSGRRREVAKELVHSGMPPIPSGPQVAEPYAPTSSGACTLPPI